MHKERHTAVEGVRLRVLVGLLGAGVGDGVLDAGGLAIARGQGAVEGVDEEGRGGRQEDEAGFEASASCLEEKQGFKMDGRGGEGLLVVVGEDDGGHCDGVCLP